MVVVIFMVSIVLLNSTLIIYQQTNHLRNMELGFDREQLMYIKINGQLANKAKTLKEEISRNPGVISASFVSNLPTQIGNNGENWDWQGKNPEYKPLVTQWQVDNNMLETFGASLAEGSMFRQNQSGILINETFAKLIGWDSSEGKTINNHGNDHIIRGVIKDIHFNMLSDEIKPMAIYQLNPGERFTNFLMVKLNTSNIENTLSHIVKTGENLEPAFPVEYEFLDDRYNQLLTSEINLRKLISVFSVFAVLVLALGILGLILFLAEQKIT
jgi:putative ABC transport system permease protein